jgi:hypothetical protein
MFINKFGWTVKISIKKVNNLNTKLRCFQIVRESPKDMGGLGIPGHGRVGKGGPSRGGGGGFFF